MAFLKKQQVDEPTYPVTKTDEEWRAELSPEEYHVLRQAGTERAFTGEYTDTKTAGVYRCRACGAELFRSRHQVRVALRVAVLLLASRRRRDRRALEDRSFGMRRVEVRCANCGSHLGHVFEGEGYGNPVDLGTASTRSASPWSPTPRPPSPRHAPTPTTTCGG